MALNIDEFYAKFKPSSKLKKNIIESFGVGACAGIGNTCKTINEDTTVSNQDISGITDKSTIISSIKSMLTNSVNSALQKNVNTFSAMVSAANIIEVGDVGGDVDISGTSQSNDANVTLNANSTTNLQNEFSMTIKNDMKSAIEKSLKNASENNSGTELGATLSNVLASAGGMINNAVDAVAKVVDGTLDGGGIGNEVDKTNRTRNETNLKTIMKLDDSFKVNDDNKAVTNLTNQLDQSIIKNCTSQVSAKNKIKFGKVEGNFKALNVEQKNVVVQVAKCLFNDNMMNKATNDVYNSYDGIIKNMGDSYAGTTSGDIQQLGNALGAVISNTGDAITEAAPAIGDGISTAAQGVGAGVSTGAQGIGAGVSEGAQGVGKGIGSIFDSLKYLALAALFFAFIYLVFIRKSDKKLPDAQVTNPYIDSNEPLDSMQPPDPMQPLDSMQPLDPMQPLGLVQPPDPMQQSPPSFDNDAWQQAQQAQQAQLAIKNN